MNISSIVKFSFITAFIGTLLISPIRVFSMDDEKHNAISAANEEKIVIQNGDTIGQVLKSSSAKIHVIDKSSLYYKPSVELQYNNKKYPLKFKTVQDIYLSFEKDIFKSISFHLTKSIDWFNEAQIREQIKPIFEMFESNGWQRADFYPQKNYNPDNVPFPTKTESEQLFIWTADNIKAYLSVKRMTYPKDLFPRNEEIFRVTLDLNVDN